MCARVVLLCVVITWLALAEAYVSKRTCSSCTRYASCPAAVALLHRQEQAADNQLKSAFCGKDSSLLPMVCCSELKETQPEPTSTSSQPESVENHPNLGLLPAECGKIDGDKISSGTIAGLYEFPWMVLISYDTRVGLDFECGGSLINERYVLTAAHCIDKRRVAGVRVGEHDIDTESDCEGEYPLLKCESHLQDIRVAEIIVHEDFNGKLDLNKNNDIGLIRLKKRVRFAKNAAPVCLPVTRELQTREVGGLKATVAGWGATELGRTSSKLLTVAVPVYDRNSCSQLPLAKGAYNKLCAGKTGKGACAGDSGGPLMIKGQYKSIGHRYIQHGLVSYGSRNNCGSDFPGIYTDVTKYTKWILDHMKP